MIDIEPIAWHSPIVDTYHVSRAKLPDDFARLTNCLIDNPIVEHYHDNNGKGIILKCTHEVCDAYASTAW